MRPPNDAGLLLQSMWLAAQLQSSSLAQADGKELSADTPVASPPSTSAAPSLNTSPAGTRPGSSLGGPPAFASPTSGPGGSPVDLSAVASGSVTATLGELAEKVPPPPTTHTHVAREVAL